MYLGSFLSKDNACSKDYSIRLVRARWKFASLPNHMEIKAVQPKHQAPNVLTVLLNQFFCMAQNVDEWLRAI